MKERIKESAFERRQELPAGTGAAPLCQPLKCGADYRDATAALKMKRSRRLLGEKRTFLAVAILFSRRRRRKQEAWAHVIPVAAQKNFLHNCTMATAEWEYTEEKCFFKKSTAEQHSFSSIFNGLPLKIEIKPRM